MIKGIFKRNVSFLVCRKEYDSPENNELLNWLERENWEIKEKNWNLVGSQEITTYQISKNNIKAKLVFETYEGVTLITNSKNEHIFDAIRINT